MKRNAFALILSMMLIVVLLTLGAASFNRTAADTASAGRYMESTQAFWVSEAGINFGLIQLRNDFTVTDGTAVWSGTVGDGEYSIDLSPIASSKRTMTSHGYIPSVSNPRLERIVEVEISQAIPGNFYDNTIYSAGDVSINGNSFDVDALDEDPNEPAILYADEYDAEHPENVTGTTTQDSDISPLAMLDFDQLYATSLAQGNVYDEDRLQDVTRGWDSFPADFWYDDPSDPLDPTTGTPNVVYVECDLTINGNIGTIGGFYVVAGDVITDPDATEDASIVGSGRIEGAIYTRGELNVNGGGATGLAVDGGIWAGEGVTINGSAEVTYNEDYMQAIEALSIDPEAQIITWKENTNPYPLQ
ncbi:hypothetical protein ACFL5X_02550 [Candidatus Omnitrophota bacterium]